MDRDAYLAEVGGRLELPTDQRTDVLEELAAHVADGIADLVARGQSPADAEAELLRRLGPPEQLASNLLRARATTSRLLSAVGAGAVAAIRTGLAGAFAGWLLAATAAVVATLILQTLQPLLALPTFGGWTSGWNSVITAVGLGLGAALGGAAAVRVVAARSWRSTAEVRLGVALAGMAVIGYLVLVASEQALNWASVVALLAVPPAFAVGAWLERIRMPDWRRGLLGSVALLAGVAVVGAAGGYGSRGQGSYEWSTATHGYEMIGPWWRDPTSPDQAFISSSGGGSVGVQTIAVDAVDAATAGQFRDVRFEAWRAQRPQDGWALDPRQAGPYEVSPAETDGATISGTIRFDSQPGLEWAEVVLTGVAADGRRYLLWAHGGPDQTEFVGSVWAWFAALGH